MKRSRGNVRFLANEVLGRQLRNEVAAQTCYTNHTNFNVVVVNVKCVTMKDARG